MAVATKSKTEKHTLYKLEIKKGLFVETIVKKAQ